MGNTNISQYVDSLFLKYHTGQKIHKTGTVKVDSTNYSKDVHTQAKIVRQNTAAAQTTQTPTTQKPVTQTSQQQVTTGTTKPQTASKPKPKPVETREKIDISCGQTTVGDEEQGHFHTNLPVFESANITKPQAPYATTDGGVEIYIAGNGNEENPVTLRKCQNGSTEIHFANSNIKAYVPSQENPKDTMIVYNPDTQTMVFNNVEGVKIKSEINGAMESVAERVQAQTKGSGNILVNGGSVAEFNTAEIRRGNQKKTGNGYQEGPKVFMRENSSQNIVLNNTKVESFDTLNDLYITLGDTEIRNTNNHPEFRGKGGDTRTYWATDGKTTSSRAEGESNGNGQSYFTVAQGLKWLNGGQDAKNIDTEDTRGSINVNNDVMNIKFENVPVSRTLNGVNIYIKGGDAKLINNRGSVDNSGGYINFNGTNVQFPQQAEGKNANIYYDAETQTIVFENIVGLDVNYSETQDQASTIGGYGVTSGAKKGANVYIKNCHCNHVDFMERNGTKDGKWVLDNNADAKSKIMIDGESQVDELITYRDDVYLHSDAEVSVYGGIETNVHGQDIEDKNAFHGHRNDINREGRINGSKNYTDLLPKFLRNLKIDR